MEYYSPLRYPGGKRKLAPLIKQVFKDNYLYDGVYVEPYAGGASIALSLLFNEYASKVIINDIDPSIYAFWHSVLFNTEDLCKLVRDVPVNVRTWRIQKAIQRSYADASFLELGFSTLFLNRTNRSGILKAGIIGGSNQSGEWKIDSRYNKPELTKRIQRIAKYKERIKIFNLDACQLLRRLKNQIPKKCLFYFDPPYYAKGKALYLNYYKDEDHVKICGEIKSIVAHKWIVTYDNVPFIRKLYSGFRQVKYHLAYTAGAFSTGEEILILSDGLYIPSLTRKAINVGFLKQCI